MLARTKYSHRRIFSIIFNARVGEKWQLSFSRVEHASTSPRKTNLNNHSSVKCFVFPRKKVGILMSRRLYLITYIRIRKIVLLKDSVFRIKITFTDVRRVNLVYRTQLNLWNFRNVLRAQRIESIPEICWISDTDNVGTIIVRIIFNEAFHRRSN